MKLPAEIFRTYDIRGVVGKSLTPPIVRDIGRALGSLGREKNAPTFAVCRDGRLSGPELIAALSEGILAAGGDVIDVGMAPTPIAYFAAYELKCDSCVAVSGSHNPPQYNGLKMVVAGTTLYGDEIQRLRTRIEAGELQSGAGKRSERNVLDAYIERIAGDVKLARPMRIAIDCGNGVAGMLAPRLYRRLGCEVTELYCEVDGRFPNHHPDPAQPENLAELIATVKKGPEELGLAFDGDGDRLGVVTKDGEIIFADRQLMLLAKDVLSRERDPSALLKSLPNAPSTPELHWQLEEGEPHRLVAKLQAAKPFPGAERVLTIDGVRVEYKDGFGLARASNTTPVIVIRFEADDERALERIKRDFRAALQPLKPDAPLPY